MSMRKSLAAAAVAAVAVLGTAGTASASGAGAVGGATGSSGLLSGNVIQVPINLPLSLCGNTIPVLAFLTSASDTACVNQ